MNQGITHVSWIFVIGLLMVITGLLNINSKFNHWDARIFNFMHVRLYRYSDFFEYLRPLGSVPVAILLILIMYIPGWKVGILGTITYIISALIERTIKMTIRRPRPFHTLSNVKIGQHPEPRDPSHPSGDSFRVWFLAILFPYAFSMPGSVFLFSIIVAGILSVGRIALGVHYPLDVIGGAGLGILSAGTALISYQLVIVIHIASYNAITLF